ncbi:MAG: alanyl-tRNA editing protein AlaXM [Candidatus Diapherotrites archaeon]
MTELLYLSDSYLKKFEAQVVSVTDGKFVVLDKCAFYPESGGQPSDTGYLEKDGNKMNVIFAKKMGENISLQVEDCNLKEGDKVKCAIDWDRRYRFMRMHTAAHILSAIIFKELGCLITGNQLGEEKSRMDFNVEDFDRELLISFEKKANEIIKRNLEVEVSYMSAEEAFKNEQLFRLKDVLPKNLKELRIVKIGDFDIQADGGTHVKNTSEIGSVKITKIGNKGTNNRRIYFILE